jgi:hypothetical protein
MEAQVDQTSEGEAKAFEPGVAARDRKYLYASDELHDLHRSFDFIPHKRDAVYNEHLHHLLQMAP